MPIMKPTVCLPAAFMQLLAFVVDFSCDNSIVSWFLLVHIDELLRSTCEIIP